MKSGVEEGKAAARQMFVSTKKTPMSRELNISRRVIVKPEIHDRCMLPLINEGIQMVDDGVVKRASDQELVWINSYGFTAHLGSPVCHAEKLGLATLLASIRRYRSALGVDGEIWFSPGSLLQRLGAAGKKHIKRL